MRLRGLHVAGALLLWSLVAASQGCGGKFAPIDGGSSSGTASSSGSTSSSGVSSGGGSSSGIPAGCASDPYLACAGYSFGVSCPPADSPQGLVCSAPVQDPSTGETLYCCEDTVGVGSSGSSSGVATGCAVDSSLPCDPGTDPVDCIGGANPEADFPGYVCSVPSPQADGSDGYCCATGFSGSTCAHDLSIQGCLYPAVGFSCAGTDTPDQADPSLTCSAGVADPNTGDTLYCCQ